jgi:hypothetical protein
VSPPAVVITIELERGQPRVTVDALGDGEYARLNDWLLHQPDLCELLRLALELAERGRRRAA